MPAPSGPFAVGREVLHLTDRSRPDPWVPSRARELMVSMFYPAMGLPGRPAPYLSETEARLLIDARGATGFVDPAELSATRTAAVVSAPARRGRYPLVVLSPGFSLHRHTLTHLAEELASRGYIVATVDHAYESVATDFPGGTLTCTACDLVAGTDGYARVAAGRARDLSFVLDRLTGGSPAGSHSRLSGEGSAGRGSGLSGEGSAGRDFRLAGDRPAWRYSRLIDRGRIGMAGHSIGGNATAATMAADPRVRAGINMDGGFFEPIPAGGLGGRPFLLLGAPLAAPAASWLRDWPLLDGWKRWLDVTGSGHMDFTDIPVIGEQAGIPDPGYPLPGSRAAEITRDYVTAFFDLHLRGIPQPLLDGPSADHPEVVFR
ncbi:lipase [Actinoplanes sp. NPDC026670]|uniref:alpha/beta hydrolase family protein n=1 Tax=Actinoplanes sp. NPDC026670 TaxID=3154700 RepID=UPI0033EEC829